MEVNSINQVKASHGWQWINQGVRYFISSKRNWVSSLFIVGMVSAILLQISPVFQIVLLIVLPFITSGLSLACADIEKGKKMSIHYLLEGFKIENSNNLLKYGFLVLILMMLSLIISTIALNATGVSNDELKIAKDLLQKTEHVSLSFIMESSVLLQFMFISLISILPIIVINSLAPILLTFNNYSSIEAVKLSLKAGIKNLSAFSVYGLIYLGLIIIMVLLLKMVIAILLFAFGEKSSIALIAYMSVFTLCVLSLASLTYCSAYVAYKDIFLGEKK